MEAFLYDVMLLVSCAVMTLGIIGILRMPDIYTKLHAASKSVFLGVTLLCASAALVSTDAMKYRIVIIALLVIMTTPIASHVVGRAAWVMHERMETPGAVDETHTLITEDDPPTEPTWRL